MIIAGAGGFAKEVYEVLKQNKLSENIACFDDTDNDNSFFLSEIPIVKKAIDLTEFFKKNNTDFVVGIGTPRKRRLFNDRIISLGGKVKTIISLNAEIGSVDVEIGDGSIILGGVRISNSVTIGEGCILYYNSVITHDCNIGRYVEISPSVTILGNVCIKDNTHIGANATILPNITIGKNVIIGAGSVVTKNVDDNTVVIGNPARFLKMNTTDSHD